MKRKSILNNLDNGFKNKLEALFGGRKANKPIKKEVDRALMNAPTFTGESRR